jgi:iron-sulfur cluster insertion protein
MVEKFRPQELNVSDQAIAKIKALLDQETNSNLSLRVFVTGGGCSGFQYGFKLDDEQDTEDTTISNAGVSVVIDSLSMQYIYGSTLDYTEDLEGSKFIIQNPNAVTTCGCGSSFSI